MYVFTRKDMHPADIKSEIAKAGTTQRAIAKQVRRSTVSVHKVIYGQLQSRPIAEAIAGAVGRSVDDLWPQRYGRRSQR